MTKRHVVIDDLYELRIVDDLVVDPGGTQAAFTVTQMVREDDCYRSQIWLLDIETGDSFSLTSGAFRDRKPQWSPDGASIAFLSNRGPDDGSANQVFIAPVTGGEPRQITHSKHGIEQFEWAPDGNRLLLVASVPEQTSNEGSEVSDVRVITSARFRADGVGYLDDRFKQIFVVDIQSGETRQLTFGPYDHLGATWSPNGAEIAFVSNRRAGWEFSSVRDLYLVKTETGVVRQLTHGDGRWSLPSWSPDGRRIAAYGTRNLKAAHPRNEVFIVSVAGGHIESATADLDVDFRDSSISDWNGWHLERVVWLDDERVTTVAGIRGTVPPVKVDLSSGNLTMLAQDSGRYSAPKPLHDGTFIAQRSDFTNPGEIVRFGPGLKLATLTAFNRDWVEQVRLVEPSAVEIQSPDGETIHGWIMRPAKLDDELAPLLLEIHGGPFGMYAETFSHEFQVLAGCGYGVLFINPRGSAGYGDRFADLLLPEMGVNDLPDLMAAVDRALDEPWVDASRLGVLGGSYGGFLTNWVVAHSDRFRAAVTQRTVSDWYSAWGTDDIFYADENQTLGAAPWEDPEIFYRLSPISYVDQITAPMLIIHSEQDYRCPISQGEELFIALKRLGRTAEFLRIPDESHGLSRTGKPAHRVERLKHILRWFETYL